LQRVFGWEVGSSERHFWCCWRGGVLTARLNPMPGRMGSMRPMRLMRGMMDRWVGTTGGFLVTMEELPATL
jgi:hypothetical protein